MNNNITNEHRYSMSMRCLASSRFTRTISHRLFKTTVWRKDHGTWNISFSSSSVEAVQPHSSPSSQNLNLVKSRDYESFLIGLLHPKEIQSSYFAIRALHVELASIPKSAVASLRLRWFLDSIDQLYEHVLTLDSDQNLLDLNNKTIKDYSAKGHPVLRELHQAIQNHQLTQRFFQRIIETRIHHAGDHHIQHHSKDEFDTMASLLDYYERTHSSLLHLNLECCGVIDSEVDQVASHIGMSLGVVNSIRSIGSGKVGIPRELLDKYDIRTECIFDPTELIQNERHPMRLAIQAAVQDMAFVAQDKINYARWNQMKCPKEGRCALLPAVSVVRYLERLKGVNYDVLQESIREMEHTNTFHGRLWRFGLMMYLFRAHLTGVF